MGFRSYGSSVVKATAPLAALCLFVLLLPSTFAQPQSQSIVLKSEWSYDVKGNPVSSSADLKLEIGDVVTVNVSFPIAGLKIKGRQVVVIEKGTTKQSSMKGHAGFIKLSGDKHDDTKILDDEQPLAETPAILFKNFWPQYELNGVTTAVKAGSHNSEMSEVFVVSKAGTFKPASLLGPDFTEAKKRLPLLKRIDNVTSADLSDGELQALKKQRDLRAGQGFTDPNTVTLKAIEPGDDKSLKQLTVSVKVDRAK